MEQIAEIAVFLAVLVLVEGEGRDGWSLVRVEGDGVEGYIASRLLTE